MVRKSLKQRKVEQVERSQLNRIAAKAARKPSRDDLARTVLWMWIHNTWRVDPHARETLDSMRNDLVDELQRQGFDPRESEERFEELAYKYKSNFPPFRIKRHLQDTPPDGQDE